MRLRKAIQTSLVCGVLAIALLMPIGHDVNAKSAQEQMMKYQNYPTPAIKPTICNSNQDVQNDSYVSKKQAAVAALGLYLGIRQATAIQNISENQRDLCA